MARRAISASERERERRGRFGKRPWEQIKSNYETVKIAKRIRERAERKRIKRERERESSRVQERSVIFGRTLPSKTSPGAN